MIKASFCAIAMLIGAAIGTYAPAEWRGDASRMTHASADIQALGTAPADRPR